MTKAPPIVRPSLLVLACVSLVAFPLLAEQGAEPPKPETKTQPAAAPATLPEPAYDPGFGDRFLQTASPLVNEKGLLEAYFQHRFNQPVNQAGGNNLFGLDSGANIGLGLNYAFLKNASFEAYRGSTSGDYEFALKVTALNPTKKLPFAVGVRGGVNWLTKTSLDKKFGGFGQLLVSVTLGERITLAAAPTYVSNTPLFTKVFNVPLILQLNAGKGYFATAEYLPRNRDLRDSVGQWSFAIEKSVWRHRFAVWIGNSGATTVDQLMAGDFGGGVRDHNIRLGFNIVRQFEVATD